MEGRSKNCAVVAETSDGEPLRTASSMALPAVMTNLAPSQVFVCLGKPVEDWDCLSSRLSPLPAAKALVESAAMATKLRMIFFMLASRRLHLSLTGILRMPDLLKSILVQIGAHGKTGLAGSESVPWSCQ